MLLKVRKLINSERYKREIKVIGAKNLEKLKNSKVAIVGIGELGSLVAYYLAAMGIGDILLIDGDRPKASNLDRQILHWEEDIDTVSKAISAKWKLQRFNSGIKIETFVGRLTKENINEVLKGVDVVVDCVDNFETSYLLDDYIDDYIEENSIPLVHAAVSGFYGQITTIILKETESLREIFPNPPAEKNEKSPLFGPVTGIVGTIEAAEVIKIITGCGMLLKNKLLIVDLARNSFEIINLEG
ncbi:MAG: ThiF family adenylyltransferase [Thermococcus sp.]|nr:ThiF family adenylyltransferase [Thermococcus sp.]